MKNKRQIASNKLFNIFVIFGLLFAWMAVEFFMDGDVAWMIGTGIVALLCLILPAIFTPFCYLFDSEGVSLCYLFLPTERYLWKNVRAIEVEDISIGTKHFVFDFFYAFVFHLKGNNEGDCRFYMKGNIRKSFRTKHLLEKYWDGTITGYLLEDVKKWFDKRNAKKQAKMKVQLTDEILPMEREVRAKSREWVKPLIAQAMQYDLDIKVKYLYITEDFEQSTSRPKEGYTYTLVAEIARFNETDDDRIVWVGVDLLYVRLGKIAYRGVLNEHAEEEVRATLSDVLAEINRIGIEAYCDHI